MRYLNAVTVPIFCVFALWMKHFLRYFCPSVSLTRAPAIAGKSPAPFPSCDWRFNEFPNPSVHALHVTCVELMALPVSGEQVGLALFDVICKGSSVIRSNMMAWINAVGLLFTSLPVSSSKFSLD